MNLNEKIGNILKHHKEGEPFFDALDFMIRGDKDILSEFKKFMDNNIFHPSGSNLVLTGKFALALLNNYGNLLYTNFNKIIVVEGDLRNGNIPELYITSKSKLNYILVDDSYYSGKTKRAIEKVLGIKFSKVIVIYDGSKEKDKKVFSLYRYHK